MNKPPFEITNAMVAYCMKISSKIDSVQRFGKLAKLPTIRRKNLVKAIQASLAIEGNSLSVREVRNIIDEISAPGTEEEILEVENAYEAYGKAETFDPCSDYDLIKAHRILTRGLKEDKWYRDCEEGVFNGEQVIFLAPPPERVPDLMKDLFIWLNEDKETVPLIKSCVFHYEFVFIHPFTDGNGRTARLWQRLLLTGYHDVFEYLPIESEIMKSRPEYYEAIAKSNKAGNSTAFVEYMLKTIDRALDELLATLKKIRDHASKPVNTLLGLMEVDVPYSSLELMAMLKVKSRDTLRNTYLRPAIENGLVEMSYPEHPNSKNQSYTKVE